ncbi:site-specific integrase [Halalkalibacter sp. APA_J-10(15)]|uniref:site-specific integrase n=1 Tax=Halalkalibacter sp. APA_J-10(15) TaxID=2933805 RepID=UPI001FF3A1E3|nr:site-specific integrase [Halalkalibacter sp. APA_J-10(15)]MCK0471408.1 site-specific integrase [Halalkalibacter sp. APA_J-10(15)]
MNVVQPIRDPKKVHDIAEFLQKISERNYMLFFLGINTGLRIKDILNLKVKDVTGHYLTLREFKTKKQKRQRITPDLYRELKKYCSGMNNDEYLFQSRKGSNKPIVRETAYRILREAAEANGLDEIGCHTLRKTFGYHFYNQTKDIALLQKLLNHTSQAETLRYIGVDQDAMDNAMRKFKIK